MGLHWASINCDKSKFILKVDDDTVFNLEKTYQLLKTLNHSSNFFMGWFLNNTRPRRNKKSKWYVSWHEYSRTKYPLYLSGWYYITTPRVAAMVCDEAIYHPFFWIDDVFVTGILTEALAIKLRKLPDNYFQINAKFMKCCVNDMIKKSIKCDYVIGPNGGMNNLIVEFNNALRNCNSWQNCTARAESEPLDKVCVAYKKRKTFRRGGKAKKLYTKLYQFHFNNTNKKKKIINYLLRC